MAKIALIYPQRMHYAFGTTPHVHVEADAGSYPPIGMLYIAAYIQRHSAHEVLVLDGHTEQVDQQGVEQYLLKHRPDVVGIYFSTYYVRDSILTAASVRDVLPNAAVVAGGPHVDFYPSETVSLPYVDYVMQGDSERSFLELVNHLSAGDLDAAGAMNNVVTSAAPEKEAGRCKIEDLDSLPFPARHLLPHKKYNSILARSSPITTIITSRGCPFKCYFCSNIESGQRVRYRSAGNVVDELEEVSRSLDIHDFLIFDELFTSNADRVFQICDEILRRDLVLRWHCRSRADVLDRRMVKSMKRAGCRLIQFGVETGVPRLQKKINKNLNLDRVRQTLAMAHDHGIYTYANFMFGLPTETEAEARQTLEFAKSLKLDFAAFGMFHPIPGSVFYDRGLKEERFSDHWLAHVLEPGSTIKDHSWTGRDRAHFDEYIARAYMEFYLRPQHIFRWLRRVDSANQVAWMFGAGTRVIPRMLGQQH